MLDIRKTKIKNKKQNKVFLMFILNIRAYPVLFYLSPLSFGPCSLLLKQPVLRLILGYIKYILYT